MTDPYAVTSFLEAYTWTPVPPWAYPVDVIALVGAVIPARRSRKQPVAIDGHIYALRNRIERCFNKPRNSRRLATRYDKTADSYLGFIHIAAVRLWFNHFVNTT